MIPTLSVLAAFTSPSSEAVRTAPDVGAPLRGFTQPGESFWASETVQGSGCDAGWLAVEAQGFVCADRATETDVPPRSQPVLVSFDPPDPAEFDAYMKTGLYDHEQPELLVPAIYAKRWRRFDGALYADLEALEAGAEPVGQLERGAGMKYHFEGVIASAVGPVLLREDGKVARLSDVYLYPVSRLQGVDLEQTPIADDQVPGITVAYGGARVVAGPEDPTVVATLPYHSVVTLGRPQGRWWPLSDGGWLDEADVRHPLPSPGRPVGVGEDALWLDIELGQQVLMLRRGDALVYFTVASTGAPPMGTPRGTYRLLAKHALKDMRSREGAADRYHVEDVPWALYFRSTYAVHGAYWHWGFGRPASHGCINLAPRDARVLFERLGPTLPDGWRTIYPAVDAPELVVRVRRGDDVGRDRRDETRW